MYVLTPESGVDTGHLKRDSARLCGKGRCAESLLRVGRVQFLALLEFNCTASVGISLFRGNNS